MADPSRKPSRDEEFKSGDIPNLAAAYLTHYLRRHFSVVYVNLFQEEKAKLARLLKENPPLCVALTTTFYVINLPVIEMVRFIRECNPTIKIIVGGPLIANHRRRLSPENLPCVLSQDGKVVTSAGSGGEAVVERIAKAAGRTWKDGSERLSRELIRFEEEAFEEDAENRANLMIYSTHISGALTLSIGWQMTISLTQIRAEVGDARGELQGLVSS